MSTTSNPSMRYLKLHIRGGHFESISYQDIEKEVTVSLRDEKGNLVTGHDAVWFNIGMRYADDDTNVLDNVVDVMNPEELCVGPSGRSRVIRVRFLQCTGPQEVVLFLKPEIRTPSNISFPSYSISKPMRVVLYRTIITNEREIPTLWFNREGGKRNRIRLKVRLVNSEGQPVTGQAVKLQCKLFYDNGEEVEDQRVLVIQASETSNCFTNPDTGEATINCRIHALTSKHKNHRFQVQVSPYVNCPLGSDVCSSDRTPGIEVRTKVSAKNRKKRKNREQEDVSVLVDRKRKYNDEFHTGSSCLLTGYTTRSTEFTKFAIPRLEQIAKQGSCRGLSSVEPMMETVNEILHHAKRLGLCASPHLHVIEEDDEVEQISEEAPRLINTVGVLIPTTSAPLFVGSTSYREEVANCFPTVVSPAFAGDAEDLSYCHSDAFESVAGNVAFDILPPSLTQIHSLTLS
jgi:hypothetical protein